MDGARLKDLAVEMRFRGDASGRTRVDLPDRWSGTEGLFDALHDLSVQGARFSRPEPAVLVLTHAPGAPITLRHRLVQDFQGALGRGPREPVPPGHPADLVHRRGLDHLQRGGRPPRPARDLPLGPGSGRLDAGLGPRQRARQGPQDRGDVRQRPRRRRGHAGDRAARARGGRAHRHPRPLGLRSPAGGRPDREDRQDLGPVLAREGRRLLRRHDPVDSRGQTVQYGVGLGDAFSLWATRNQDEKSLATSRRTSTSTPGCPRAWAGCGSGRTSPWTTG